MLNFLSNYIARSLSSRGGEDANGPSGADRRIEYSIIQPANPDDPQWASLHNAFETENSKTEQQEKNLIDPGAIKARTEFIAVGDNSEPLGFAVVSVRQGPVNGCRHSPVLYLDRIYVKSDFRNRGIAKALCDAAEEFGRTNNCREFASDVVLNDRNSLGGYKKLGFAESERVVYLRRELNPDDRESSGFAKVHL